MSSLAQTWKDLHSHSMVIFESVALSLSGCRSLIESSGSGDMVSDDSDLVCLHEGYVDGLHLA